MLSSEDTSVRKRVILGTASTAIFYAFVFLFTRGTGAQIVNIPATPPTTPPTTPPISVTVTPTVTPTPGDDDNKATGGVTAQFGGKVLKLSFNAQEDGGDVKGHVNYSDNTGDNFKGDVDVCYEQSGNTAVFVGTVDEKKSSVGLTEYFYVEVQDNGEGSKSSPDKVRVKTYLGAPDCTFSGLLPAKVIKGNLQVHD